MKVSVTFRNMEPSDSLKEYASEKCMRLKKYIHRPTDVNIILAKHKYRNRAEIKMAHAGVVMKGEENTEDMYSSIDLALDKVERQVKRLKGKLQEHRAGSQASELSNLTQETDVDEEAEDRVREIDSEEFFAKPMSVEEAVMQMDLNTNDFLVFVNSSTNDVNVVYKKRDGNIGLIEAKTPTD